MRLPSTVTILVLSYSSTVLSFPSPWSWLTRARIDGRSTSHNVSFECGFPSSKDRLPLFELGAVVKFPDDKFYEILKSSSPDLNLTKQGDETGDYYYDGGRLVGYYDVQSGETGVFPRLSSLQPGNLKLDQRLLLAFARNHSIIPGDDTKYSIVIGSRLGGSQQAQGGRVSPPADYLLEGIIQRGISHQGQLVPVCGPGSRGSFHFGADGQVKSLTHRWRSAKAQTGVIRPLPSTGIQKQIEAQLLAANLTTNVTVRAIELCFYDSGNKFIQPVFRFNATISQPYGLADELVIGYVPAGGNELEPLPTLNPPVEQAIPGTAINGTLTTNGTSTTNGTTTITKRQSRIISVGRYAMSHDQYSNQIVVDENAFLSGLTKSAPGRFLNSQYFWDEPLIYESPTAPFFVDAVNVAFTEGHGNVHLFTTNESLPYWGTVRIASDLPSNGFGPGARGNLAYWFIRACATVSSPADYAKADWAQAFDPWWQVFNGMHAVLGYRDNAAVYDNEMGKVGTLLGKGAGVVHGWMKEARGGGKTSAVTVCGHDDDNIFQIENVGRPGCLRIWWYT